MLQLFAIAFGIASVFAICVGAAVLTYTALFIIAGTCIGFVIGSEWQKERDEQRRAREDARDYQRINEMVKVCRSMGARVDIPTIEIPKKVVGRLR